MAQEQELARAFLERRISRREMLESALRGGASLSLLGFLVSCGAQAPAQSPAPTAAPAAPAAPQPAATAAGQAAAPTSAPAPAPAVAGGRLRMSYSQVVADTLNQHVSNFTQTRMIGRHVLDCLVAVNPATGEVTPWLAESWEISEDGREYTFKLRQDVKFHDGTPFNAEAVKFNFDYTMDPNTKHGFAYGALGGAKYKTTEVVDEYTVKVIFNEPHGTFLPFLSDGGAGIDSPTAIKEHGENYGITALVGTGPYRFVEWVPKDRVVLVPNPDYAWASAVSGHQGPPFLEELIFQEIPENATRAAALQNGDVQMAQLVESQASDFDGSPDVEIVLVPKPGTVRMYVLNMNRPALSDIRVRQAINHAIDKEALIQLPAWSGIGRPGIAPLPANMVPNGDLSQLTPFDYPYDPERAAALLDEAGWTLGPDGVRSKDGQPLILEVVTTSASVPTVEPVDGMLNALGIRLKINAGDFNFYAETAARGEYDITLRSDSGYNAVGMVEEYFHTRGVYNTHGMETLEDHEAIDAAIDQALTTPDYDTRWEGLFTAMELVMKNAVAVMGWEIDYVFGVRNDVEDVTFNEVGYPYFYDVRIAA
jgi:peptide/nickel transport system substrate-binding protein